MGVTGAGPVASGTRPVPVADGIYRLGDSWTNWYVIEEGSRLTVVDSGYATHWSQFLALLESLGRTVRDVEAVLLTHAHPDHMGCAERIRTEASAPVFVHTADLDAAKHAGDAPPGLYRAMLRPAVARYMLHFLSAGGMRFPRIAQLRPFEDGELDVPGRPRVIHAPGHTPGACVLLLETRDVLVSGDSLTTLNIDPHRTGPTLLTPPFVRDQAAARASLDRIEATGAGTMLSGHGEPWRAGVAEAVRIARGR